MKKLWILILCILIVWGILYFYYDHIFPSTSDENQVYELTQEDMEKAQNDLQNIFEGEGIDLTINDF